MVPPQSESDGVSVESNIDLKKAAVALLLGLGILGYGYIDYTSQGDRLENAVEVDATILETHTERSGSTSTDTTDATYYPVVEFEYTFEGTTYTSSNLYPTTIDTGHSDESSAEAAIADYEEGETVTAYVDPDDPGEAFLRDETDTPVLLFLVGGVLVLGGIGILVRREIDRRGSEGR